MTPISTRAHASAIWLSAGCPSLATDCRPLRDQIPTPPTLDVDVRSGGFFDDEGGGAVVAANREVGKPVTHEGRWLHSSVTALGGVSVGSRRFAGTEYRLGPSELGHSHLDGRCDILFDQPHRDLVLDPGIAQSDRYAPVSGWATVPVATTSQNGLHCNRHRLEASYPGRSSEPAKSAACLPR